MGLVTRGCLKRQLSLTGSGRAWIIFAALAPYLVLLAERRERVADRHFARLVALEIHPLKNVAAGQAGSLADKIEKLFASGTAPRLALWLRATAATCLASLCRVIGVEGLEFAIDRGEPVIKLAPLARNFLALA